MQKTKLNINRNLLLFIVTMTAYFLAGNAIYSEVKCTGTACSSIPQNYLNQFTQLDGNFRNQYLNVVTDSMLKSALMSNTGSGLIGAGAINRVQIGAGASVGAVKEGDITVTSGDITFPKMPAGGVGIAPYAMGAVNLGWLFKKGPSEDGDKRSFLHRFNIYGHGLAKHYDIEPDSQSKTKTTKGEIFSKNYGAMVRFQIIRDFYTKFYMFGFTGLSIGAGFNSQEFHLTLESTEKKPPTVKFGTTQGTWGGATILEFNSKAQSIPIDIRAGIRVGYVLTVFGGVGTSFNSGSADIHLNRTGPFTVTTSTASFADLAKLQGYALPTNVTNLNTPLSQQAILSMDFRSYSKSRQRIDYGIAGIELNLWYLKIVAEAMILKGNNYQASVGTKLAF